MKRIFFLAIFVVGLCLSGASDASAYLINLRPQPDPSNTGSNPTSYSISTTTSVLSMTFTKTSAGNAGIGGSDVITIAPTSTSMYIYASTTVSGGATCRINAASTANGNNQSFSNYAQSSGLSSGTATTTLTLPSNAYGTYLGLVLTIDNGGAGRGCAMDIYSVVVNGNQLLLAPPPPPSPTTPSPMTGFTEQFDNASTTAGTALVDTWGQVGFVQPSSGSGQYAVIATSTAPSAPNAIANIGGSKSVGFFVATSTDIEFSTQVFIGSNHDFTINLYAQGATGTNFTGTSTLSMTVCTRNSCGLGVPQVTINSVGSLFGCSLMQATSTYTGNSWVPFTFRLYGENGSIQVWLDGEEYSTMCNSNTVIPSPLIEVGPSAYYDNFELLLDGDVPPLLPLVGTRIISSTPPADTFIATTSSAYPFEVESFVAFADFTDDVEKFLVQFQYTHVLANYEVSQIAGSYGQDIFSSGNDVFTGTMAITATGTYNISVRLFQVLTAPWWQPWKDDMVIEYDYRTYQIIVATSTSAIQIWEAKQAQDARNAVTPTTTMGLVQSQIAEMLNQLLYAPPIGYGAHIFDVLSATTTATSTISITHTVPAGMPGAGKSLTLNVSDGIAQSIQTLNSADIETIEGGAFDKFMEYWSLMWYMALVIWIVQQIFSMYQVSLVYNPNAGNYQRSGHVRGISSTKSSKGTSIKVRQG